MKLLRESVESERKEGEGRYKENIALLTQKVNQALQRYEVLNIHFSFFLKTNRSDCKYV